MTTTQDKLITRKMAARKAKGAAPKGPDIGPGFELIPLLSCQIDLGIVPIGVTPRGMSQLFYVKGGSFEFINGDNIRGQVLPYGGDWTVDGTDAVTRLDARAIFQPEGVAGLPYIMFQTNGVIILPPTLRQYLVVQDKAMLDWDAEGVVCMSSVRFEVASTSLFEPFLKTRLASELAQYPDDKTDLRTPQLPAPDAAPVPDWGWLNRVMGMARGRLRHLGIDWTVYSVVPARGTPEPDYDDYEEA
jgi:hypothetical protein